MRGWLVLAALTVCSCAGKQKFSVLWPDKSQDEKLWACLKDPDDSDQIICLEFGRALLYLGGGKDTEAEAPNEGLPTFDGPRTDFEL